MKFMLNNSLTVLEFALFPNLLMNLKVEVNLECLLNGWNLALKKESKTQLFTMLWLKSTLTLETKMSKISWLRINIMTARLLVNIVRKEILTLPLLLIREHGVPVTRNLSKLPTVIIFTVCKPAILLKDNPLNFGLKSLIQKIHTDNR